MAEENKNNRIKWEVAEFKKPARDKNWYTIAGSLAALMIFFSFFNFRLHPFRLAFLGANNNFLFALIIVLAIIIMFILESREPKMVKIKLDSEGLTLGQKFYDYDDFKNFCVLYKPKESVKNLYLEFKNSARFRISLPLRSLDPLLVRNFLKKYLEEDLERTTTPLSEKLTKVLKL